MTGYAFISYSRADRVFVERLVAHLTKAGIPTWYDYSIPSGARFDQLIDNRIQQCSAFLVVMTPAGFDSDWVANELSHAQGLHKPILPLLLSGRPFLAVSSRDYENVMGEVMPSSRFLKTLRGLLVQQSAESAESAGNDLLAPPTLRSAEAKTGYSFDPPTDPVGGREPREFPGSSALQVGATFVGTVVRTAGFGAFVSLLPGRDGLLHISKVGDGKRVDKVEDFLNVGDEVEVTIADIDRGGKIYLDKVRPENTGVE